MKLLLTLLIAISSFALEYNFHQGASSTNGIRTEYADFRFNDQTKTLMIEAQFSNKDGKLAQGFHIALSENYPGTTGQIAMIYFDVSNGLSDPCITAYAYNARGDSMMTCANYLPSTSNPTTGYYVGSWKSGTNSYLTSPDAIFSNLYKSDTILERSAVDQVIAGVTYRTMRLVLDTSKIDGHVPEYLLDGYQWKGAKFANSIGVWMFVTSNFTTSYNTISYYSIKEKTIINRPGFLTSYTAKAENCSIIDFANCPSNESPLCAGTSVIADELKPGEPITIRVKSSDAEKDSLVVNYTSLPSGATTNPANGTTLIPDANKEVTAQINWTPGLNNIGDNILSVIFAQKYGVNQASVSCPVTLRINQPVTPTCSLTGNSENLLCSGVKTTLLLDGSGSTDDGSPDPLTYTWTTDCPNASITKIDKTAQVIFDSEKNNAPTSCKVRLTLSDGLLTSFCERNVTVKSCQRDCLGVINGTAKVDRCGVCNGNNACVDCAGVPNGGKVVDRCGVCGGNNSCLDCAGIPNGTTRVDLCGVCGGNNSCLDCAGVPNGGKVIDLCGVCGGSNSCLDCRGVPNGTTRVDLCGVCGGNNACLDCTGVPNGGKIIDSCGICGGNNSCLDCKGVPNGTAKLDRCGICGGDGTSCNTIPVCSAGIQYNLNCNSEVTTFGLINNSYDVDGLPNVLRYNWSTNCPLAQFTNPTISNPSLSVKSQNIDGTKVQCKVYLSVTDGLATRTCQADVGINSCYRDCTGKINGNAVLDLCGACNGNNACLDCSGVPNGGKVIDRCGVCGGNNSCLDCSGVPNGGKVIDRCGVCGGNNSCLDCAGTPFGSAKVDQCGVCGGDGKSCLDCAGTVNGTAKVDKCGVCGGNNSCLDCAGTPFGTAKLDRCLVCNGDGTSCLGCTNVNTTSTIRALDNGAALILSYANTATKELKKLKVFTTKEASLLATAKAANISAWTSINSIPTIVQTCTNSSFCTSVSLSSATTTYAASNTTLVNSASSLITKWIATLKKKKKSLTYANLILAKVKEQSAKNSTGVASVPTTQSSCK